MQLILMRHGEALAATSTDESRTLSRRGQQQALSTARQLLEHYQPDLFVVSPLLRAQQTRQAFAQFCPDVPVLSYNGIKPEDDARSALNWLSQQQAQCMVVVCHMNIVAYMAALLLGEHPESFALAEARVYEQVAIVPGFSGEIARFFPQEA
ncbi:SixA phosphatase family protein [Alkanindiges sp. WGS2144]|uniref:SixA phosphatase family protein n=1 Tax=Alkanindiges sp. WGS2144 TaxID=3366808 RepID=UPI003750A356